MQQAKPFWKSKRFWGAAITMLSTTGLLSIGGVSLDVDTWTVTIVLPTLAEKIMALAIPGGTVIGFWGAFVAKHVLRLR